MYIINYYEVLRAINKIIWSEGLLKPSSIQGLTTGEMYKVGENSDSLRSFPRDVPSLATEWSAFHTPNCLSGYTCSPGGVIHLWQTAASILDERNDFISLDFTRICISSYQPQI